MKHTSKILIALLVLATMLMSLTVLTVNAEESSAPVEYKFDVTTDVTPAADKTAITAGTTYANYFTVSGTVKSRGDTTKVTSIEIEKNELGSIDFTVSADHIANVTIEVSSTGGTNTSTVAIVDANSAALTNNEGITEVTGTSKVTLTYTGLKAGDYQIVSPQSSYGRGFRLYTISVVESVASCDHNYVDGLCSKCEGQKEGYFADYEFDGTDVTVGADKDVIAEGTTYENGFFTVVGAVTQRVKNDAVYAVEVGKDATGAIEFKVECFATVVIKVASTGGSNTSVFGIVDAKGNPVANNEELTEVTGTSNVTATYSLTSGTYRVVSPVNEDETKDRSVRISYVKVTTQKCDHTYAENDVCSKCNALDPEHVHAYGEYEVTTAPGCETAGVKTATCGCGATQTEEVAALGHTYFYNECYVCKVPNPYFQYNFINGVGEHTLVVNQYHLVDTTGHGNPYQFTLFTVAEAGHYKFTSDKLIGFTIFTTEVNSEGADWTTGTGASWAQYIAGNEADLEAGTYYIGYIFIEGEGEYKVTLEKVVAEDPQPEDPKPEDPKPEDNKPEDNKGEENQPEEKLNFFQKIWRAILAFFQKLFAKKN